MYANEKRQIFRLAIEIGVVSVVERLMTMGESCNGNDFDGYSPLHIAVLARRPSMVSYLLNVGADVNSRNTENLGTPLHAAAGLDNDLVVKRLLAAPGVQVEAQMSNSVTALHIACHEGHFAVVKALLDGGANIEAITDTDQLTPLFFAVAMSRYDVFKILVDAGANLFAVNNSNCNLLHVAAIEGFCIEGVKTLIEKFVDVHGRDINQVTPLYNATLMGNVEIVEVFLQNGADMDAQDLEGHAPLHKTAVSWMDSNVGVILTGDSASRTEVARLLIEHGARVNMPDTIGRTPLHLAVINRELDLMLVLMDEGNADVNAITQGGSTLLYCAVSPNASAAPGDCVAVVEALLNHGSEPNTTDDQGRSVLHTAAAICNVKMVKALLNGGCYYDLKDDDNKLPVFYTDSNPDVDVGDMLRLVDRFFQKVINNDDEFITFLCILQCKDLVRFRSKVFMSPLHYPAWMGFLEVAELLLKHGADPCASEKNYASPIHFAAIHNNSDVALALLKKGAMFNEIHKKQNKTALTYAVEANSADMVSLLRLLQEMFTATENGHTRVIQNLNTIKEQNANLYQAIVNARNCEGQKLIDVAQKHHHNDIAACLI